jgi:hypothetical protein
MKNIVFLGMLLFYGFVFGQTGARIEFKNKENTIDFGTVIKDNDNGIRSFEFVNTGDADLIISSVNSTFGCVARKNKEVILPGNSGFIEIKCGLVVGTMRKTIVVESNAINVVDCVVKLTVKGVVVK